MLAIVFGSAFGLHQLTEFLISRVADPKLSLLVVAVGGFGCAIALFALALQRQASLAKRWPVVSGVIKRSEIESYRAAPSETGSRGSMMYERKISYTYRYQGVSYTNVQAGLSSRVASTSSRLVRKSTADWKNGSTRSMSIPPISRTRPSTQMFPWSGCCGYAWPGLPWAPGILRRTGSPAPIR